MLIWKARSSVNDDVMVSAKLDGRDVRRIVDKFCLCHHTGFGSCFGSLRSKCSVV